jgi:hypothetical protein
MEYNLCQRQTKMSVAAGVITIVSVTDTKQQLNELCQAKWKHGCFESS